MMSTASLTLRKCHNSTKKMMAIEMIRALIIFGVVSLSSSY